MTAKLVPQRAYHRRGKPLSSASYEQRPDIAIEIEQPGAPTRVIIFDPKYKLDSEKLEGEVADGRPKKVDIDKMHAYRDASRNPADERAVIYPGASSQRFGSGLEAIAARPGEVFEHDVRAALKRTLSIPIALTPRAA